MFAMLFLPPFFLLSHTIRQKISILSFFSIRIQWVDYQYLPKNGTAHDLAWRGALLQLLVVPCSLSFLPSIFCRTGDLLSHRNSPTQRNLCFLVNTRRVLSRFRCSGHSLQVNSDLSRIESPLWSSHLSSHYTLSGHRLLAPFALRRFLFS